MEHEHTHNHTMHDGAPHRGTPPAGHHAHHAGHDRHAGHSVAMFRDKFWLTLILTVPVVVWSTDVQRWLAYTAPRFPGSQFIPAFFGTVVFFYGGAVFIRGALGELADKRPGMMTLISLGIVVAFVTSLAARFGMFAIDVWWELATLITIMVLGHWLEMRAISQATGALSALAALLPDTAERITGSETKQVSLSELRGGVGGAFLSTWEVQRRASQSWEPSLLPRYILHRSLLSMPRRRCRSWIVRATSSWPQEPVLNTRQLQSTTASTLTSGR